MIYFITIDPKTTNMAGYVTACGRGKFLQVADKSFNSTINTYMYEDSFYWNHAIFTENLDVLYKLGKLYDLTIDKSLFLCHTETSNQNKGE